MLQKAIFGAGCFWGVEAAFRALDGVSEAISGYCGGTVDHPDYQQVCSGRSDHAEVVEVTFDPDKVSYDTLLDTFWACHNPTQHNRQGPDVGTQYRSVIFTIGEAQQSAAIASRGALEASGQWADPIATRIEPAATFWPAEDYHQRYFEKRGIKPTCHL